MGESGPSNIDERQAKTQRSKGSGKPPESEPERSGVLFEDFNAPSAEPKPIKVDPRARSHWTEEYGPPPSEPAKASATEGSAAPQPSTPSNFEPASPLTQESEASHGESTSDQSGEGQSPSESLEEGTTTQIDVEALPSTDSETGGTERLPKPVTVEESGKAEVDPTNEPPLANSTGGQSTDGSLASETTASGAADHSTTSSAESLVNTVGSSAAKEGEAKKIIGESVPADSELVQQGAEESNPVHPKATGHSKKKPKADRESLVWQANNIPEITLVPLSEIGEHPGIERALKDRRIIDVADPPKDYLNSQGIKQLLLSIPIHVVLDEGIFQCFAGLRTLAAAKDLIPEDTSIPVLIYKTINKDQIRDALQMEYQILFVLHRQWPDDRAKLNKRCTTGNGQESDSLTLVRFKKKWADILKSSATSLRDDEC